MEENRGLLALNPQYYTDNGELTETKNDIGSTISMAAYVDYPGLLYESRTQVQLKPVIRI